MSEVKEVLELSHAVRRAWIRSTRFKVGAALSSFVLLLAILGPLVAPYPSEGMGTVPPTAAERTGRPPSFEFPMGTDNLGRDVLSRVLMGARLALIQITTVVAASLAIGLVVGVLAAYYRGPIEVALNYLTEVFLALPAIVMALALRLALGQGFHTLLFSLILSWWPWYARASFVYARSVVEMDYVLLARLAGVPDRVVLLRHVLWNILQPVLVQAITDLGSVLLEASAINFLGLGLKPDEPDWGIIAQNGFKYITSMPWISLFPGLFILLTALGFSLLGDALREELDPRLRRRWKLWF
ncbi:MAG: ABC transporter permease [Thermofilaceae archaeon]